MGTRADFYVGVDPATMEYLGSIAWDGNEIGPVERAVSEIDYRARVFAFVGRRRDGSLPERDGWPWPWEDSRTTDCAYTWHNGRILEAVGRPERWVDYPASWDNSEGDDKPRGFDAAPLARFPNMKAIQRVNWGKRSGLITITADGIVEDP